MAQILDLGTTETETLATHPVWEFILDAEQTRGETCVRPVTVLPVDDLGNRVVVTHVMLANGETRLALLANISVQDKRRTSEFLQVSIQIRDGDRRWFHLARYFDTGYEERSPSRLAEELGLPVDGVFPVSYDISRFVKGDTRVLRSAIPAEPRERLSDEERLALLLG